ncbi:MAG: beta-propeller domain-containing protein, partial [Clostridia bacterium]|nr:beta-propeller domain-containing protein [Clostridia bacterium]
EITDHQVEGISEADRIKRSDSHIYYLDSGYLRIYSIEQENTKEVGAYKFEADGGKSYQNWSFYLSSDCKTVTVISLEQNNIYSNSVKHVCLLSLDVSDPANIVKKGELQITGSYMSSRAVNGNILLFIRFAISEKKLDFGDESTFLPQVDEGAGAYFIPVSSMIFPENPIDIGYTVVMKLDESTLEIKDTATYLFSADGEYVSENHIFLYNGFTDETKNRDFTVTRVSMTEIACLTYGGDKLEVKGSATVSGYLKDQWSMDEYSGILRVFATTATGVRGYIMGSDNIDRFYEISGSSNASLYCIDLSSFETVASVVDFAPPDERIQSVRFDKEKAYVCTAIGLTDPVFFFDLTDLDNITYEHTGTVAGFSSSLIDLGNGYLLGIGSGGSRGSFKVEVYSRSEEANGEAEYGVRSVCKYELEDTYYSLDYKSYYVDRQNQLIGIGIDDYSRILDVNDNVLEECRYILLHFDGEKLVELINVQLDGSPENKRGVYIDGYMYMFGDWGFNGEFKVEKVSAEG